MDLILLQPGDPTFFPPGDWSTGGTLVNSHLQDAHLNAGQCIELVSLHQGMHQSFTTNKAAPSTNHPVITELTCVKYVDKLSSKLYEYCLRAEPLSKGKAHPTLIYILRNNGDHIVNVMTITLRDALVSEIQVQLHTDDMPTEQFKLNFTEILWTYTEQTTDSNVADKVSAGWSKERNRTITGFTDSCNTNYSVALT